MTAEELGEMIRRIVREELSGKTSKEKETLDTNQCGNGQLIDDARKKIEATVLNHAEKNSLPKTPEEKEKKDEEERIKLAMKTIEAAFSAKDRPEKIYLGRCVEAKDSDKNYFWWKTFLSGLNLYPYVLTTRHVPREEDRWEIYSAYDEIYLSKFGAAIW